MEEKTDKQLYQEFLNGSQESFEAIVIKHKDRMIYFLQRYIKNIERNLSQNILVFFYAVIRVYMMMEIVFFLKFLPQKFKDFFLFS